MSYGLLWIEALLASLIFSTAFVSIGMRRKTRKAKALCAVAAFLPLLPLGVLAFFTGMVRYGVGQRSGDFAWAIALLACYVVGAIVIRIFARRHDHAGISRAFSWPVGRLAAAWLVVVSLIAMTFWNLDLRAQMEIQALRAEAGAIALSVAPPQVPDSLNAAWVYQQADEQFQSATIAADKDVDYDDLDINSAQVRQYLQRQQRTLETLRRAADMTHFRLNYDYGQPEIELVLTGGASFRKRAILLALAARAEANSGNAEMALADCGRMYAIGDHAGSSPLLISGLVSIGVDDLASKTLAQVLPAVASKEQLEHLALPLPGSLSRGFARSLRGEEAFGLAGFCDIASGNAPYTTIYTTVAGSAMWHLFYRNHIGSYRENLRRPRDLLQRPFYQTAKERKAMETELHTGRPRNIFPSWLPALKSLAEVESLRSAAVLACAATRYRLERGEYPSEVTQLTPAYLEAIPLDPFDGQPMRMKRMSGGQLVIYSIGQDGKDNDGDVESKKDNRKPADVGIILNLPESSASSAT